MCLTFTFAITQWRLTVSQQGRALHGALFPI